MRIVLQSQFSECGLACLVMIASEYGLNLDISQLRRKFPQSLRGVNLKQIINYSAELGFLARPLRLEIEELSELSTPCILHWDLNHFVVLKDATNKNAIVIVDPASGERIIPEKEFSKHFTGVALEFSPSSSFERRTSVEAVTVSKIIGGIENYWRPIAHIFIIALVLEMFALTSPLFNQVIVDDVLSSNDTDLLTILVIGFMLLLTIQTALSVFRSWLIMDLTQSLSLQWLSNVFHHLIKLPITWFESRHLGDISSRFGSINEIQKTLTTSILSGFLDGLMAMAALVMMFLYSPLLTFIVLSSTFLYAFIRFLSFSPLRNASSEKLILQGKEHSYFIETMRAIVPIKLFGRTQERRIYWQNLMVDVLNRDVKTMQFSNSFSIINTFIFGFENLLIFWMGAKLILNSGQVEGVSTFSIGMMLAFVSYKLQFTGRASALINLYFELRMLDLHCDRLADIVLSSPEQLVEYGNNQENDLTHLEASLEFKNVFFKYGDYDPWLLKDVSFKINLGESLAVVGPSGCGKSTLIKIALGVLLPQQGEVLYGGVPIRLLGIENVRKNIGTVMQGDVLLTGSVVENISFFDSNPDYGRIERYAKMAQIHDDIIQMPMGYQTLIGEMGEGLSGGQKQRIILARALYKEPKIIILDEATSFLDLKNEKAIADAIGELNLTKLIISHRPDTVKMANDCVSLG